MVRLGPVLVALVVSVAACTSSPHRSPSASTSPTSRPASSPSTPAALGRPGCAPATPITRGAGFPELHGTSSRLQLWGLLMVAGPDDPVRVNEDVKIVWRVTGSGELSLTSIDPSGRSHPLQWGPDLHTGSDYDRPGQEWGAGYRFTEPGCWQLHAVRGGAAADVWLRIAA